jgi:hypothetical protein
MLLKKEEIYNASLKNQQKVIQITPEKGKSIWGLAYISERNSLTVLKDD